MGAEARVTSLNQPLYATVEWECGSADFELAIEDDQATLLESAVLRSKEIQWNPRSPLALELYKRWLNICREGHSDCSYEDLDGYPKRLVDISSFAESNTFRVVETAYESHRYCALSYCWGGKEPLMLLHENESKLLDCMDAETLPACFLDAVHVAQGMGLRYIWIDALNILQYDKKDWDAESSRMASIYANASFVIIAANSSNPYESFLNRTEHEHQWFSWSAPTMRLSIHARLWFDHLSNPAILFPISTRAWTYQERLLARRCLIFGDFETTWECQQGCRCECSGDHEKLSRDGENASIPQMIPSRAAQGPKAGLGDFTSDEVALRYWIDAVQVYSALRMTKANDKLVALTGIASIISRATRDQYIAGLWKRHLIDLLAWRRVSYAGKVEESFAAPSWSWASKPNTVRYYPVLRRDREYRTRYRANVIEAQCQLTGMNPFGAVNSGFIRLRGLCTPAMISVESVVANELNRTEPKLILRSGAEYDLAPSPVISNEALDCLPVNTVGLQLRDGSTIIALQRASGNSYAHQATCSGSVVLFWLSDEHVLMHSNKASFEHTYVLILAHSAHERGAYERLGIADTQRLHGGALRLPAVGDSDTRVKEVKII